MSLTFNANFVHRASPFGSIPNTGHAPARPLSPLRPTETPQPFNDAAIKDIKLNGTASSHTTLNTTTINTTTINTTIEAIALADALLADNVRELKAHSEIYKSHLAAQTYLSVAHFDGSFQLVDVYA